MSIKCKIGFHSWNGCKCSDCGKIRNEHHDWRNDCDRCSICGKTRDDYHDWSEDCQKCSKCGKPREVNHSWEGCKCKKCKKTRNEQHDWSKDCEKCSRCGQTQENKHNWNGCKCAICGKIRNEQHTWNDYICLTCGEIRETSNICIDKRDKSIYKIVKVGNLLWFAENFKFNSGDSTFFNDNANYQHLGRCYSFHSALNNAPVGWRLPTNDEWINMLECLSKKEFSKFLFFDNEMTGSVNLKEYFRKNDDPLGFLKELPDECGFWTKGGRNPGVFRSWHLKNGLFDNEIIFRADIKLFVRYVKSV